MRITLFAWVALNACAATIIGSRDSALDVHNDDFIRREDVIAGAAIPHHGRGSTTYPAQEPQVPAESHETDKSSSLNIDSHVAGANLTVRAPKYVHAFELRTKIGRYNQMVQGPTTGDRLFKWMSDNLMQLITQGNKEFSRGSEKVGIQIVRPLDNENWDWATLSIWIDAGWWGKNIDLARLMVELIANAARESTYVLANCKAYSLAKPWTEQGAWCGIPDWYEVKVAENFLRVRAQSVPGYYPDNMCDVNTGIATNKWISKNKNDWNKALGGNTVRPNTKCWKM